MQPQLPRMTHDAAAAPEHGASGAAAYAAASAVVHSIVAYAIWHVFHTPGYAHLQSLFHLLIWAAAGSVACTAMAFVYRVRMGWNRASRTLIILDPLISLLPLVLIQCMRITQPAVQQLRWFTFFYALLMFLKCAVLAWYAACNAETGRTRVAAWILATILIVFVTLSPRLSIEIPDGDEPHYLLLTYSLLVDHDFDLTNNYTNLDYLAFYPRKLPDQHSVQTFRGQTMLWHDVGLPILLVPAYALGGRLGTMFEMNLIGAFLALGFYLVAVNLGASRKAAVVTAYLFSFTMPLSHYASQIFPELLGGTCTLWAVICFMWYTQSGRSRLLLCAGVLTGVLPWLCIRYWMLAIPFGTVVAGYLLFQGRSCRQTRVQDLLVFAAPIVVLIAAFSAFDHHLFGTILPNAGYLSIAESFPQFHANILVGLAGMLLDRSYGLLPLAPMYLAAFAGMWSMRRKQTWFVAALFLPALANLLFMSLSQFWAGGWCPPGRYVIATAALWVPFAAVHLSRMRASWLLWPLGFYGVLASILYVAIPRMRYSPKPRRSELHAFFARHGLDPSPWFPSLWLRSQRSDVILAICWVLIVLAMTALLVRAARAPER